MRECRYLHKTRGAQNSSRLKRLGCSGRAGMTLSLPSPTMQAKIYQLYRTSDRVPFADALVELVKLC